MEYKEITKQETKKLYESHESGF